MDDSADHVVFFDGVCSLCNGYIRFLMARDRDAQFHVAPLDGETAEQYLTGETRENAGDSIIYMDRSGDDPAFYNRSTAVLNILSRLGGPWCLVAVLKIIPRFIRDAVYNLIASNRYDWFGKHDTCPAPEPGWKERFLD